MYDESVSCSDFRKRYDHISVGSDLKPNLESPEVLADMSDLKIDPTTYCLPGLDQCNKTEKTKGKLGRKLKGNWKIQLI